MQRAATLSLGVVLAATATGCAEIHRNQISTADEVVDATPKIVASPDFDADLKQTSSVLTVRVRPKCSLVEEERVETTTTYEQDVDDGDQVWMTFLGVGGTLPLAGGVALLADSPNVYDSNPNSRTYNSTGQDAAIGLGTLLTLTGTAMIIPPMVNAFRGVGDDHETTTSTRQGKVLKPVVACDGRESPMGYSITGRTQAGATVSLGAVSPPGYETTIDLGQVLGPGFFQTMPPPVTLAVWVNQKFVGEVDLRDITQAALARQNEADELAWRSAEPDACGKQRTDAACAGVSRYLAALPSGRHAVEAQQLLQRLTPSTPVVAVDPNLGKLDRARQAAADAQQLAIDKAQQAADLEAQKAAIKAQEEVEKARKKACEDACVRECAKDVECRTSCVREICQ
ncbi:MAG TPA: hypothetical protein VL400_27020 [Polyangiaceae bacterium]|jgi:hypothetical protein|nr:hypothetical protein [Polyangiaceae bacterium]